MKNELESLYNISINSIIKISDKSYKITTSRADYILKEHKDTSLESIFARLRILNLDFFVLPISSNEEHYIVDILDKYYALYPFYEDEEEIAKELRLSFYIKAIANLHNESSYPLSVNDGFFEESISYLDNKISEVKQQILTRIERVEIENYHSPSDWFFLINYPILFDSLKEADRYVTLLEEEWKNSTNIHLSLTFQNFSYDHILLKNRKLISLDKISLAPSIYDLIELYNKAFDYKLDISYLIDEYLKIHSSEVYEQNWLLAFLFIPCIERKDNDIEDIESLNKTLSLLKISQEIVEKFNL
jgi:hypothetical protein